MSSKQFKMRTAIICVLLLSITLTGREVFRQDAPEFPKMEQKEALRLLLKEQQQNQRRLDLIETNLITNYELRQKNMESDSVQ